MMKISIYNISNDGYVTYYASPIGGVENDRYQKYLCGAILTGVQDINDCRMLLEKVNCHAFNAGKEIIYLGNDISIELCGDNVQINIDSFDEYINKPEGCFRISELKKFLECLIMFLEETGGKQHIPIETSPYVVDLG